MRGIPIALMILAILTTDAAAQETTTKPRFIGLWQNSHASDRCQFFPSSVLISAANERHATISFPGSKGFDAVERPRRDYIVVGGSETVINTDWDQFKLNDDNTMTFIQKGPDGLDNCQFHKISTQP